MGGRFSHVHYREQDAAVLPHFVLLTQVWGLDEIALLSTKLRRISFNFCLSLEQFSELLALRGNPLFARLLERWFTAFQNTRQSTVVNGLELLTALALASVDGQLSDKVGAVFDIFDFDASHAITLDELCILLKSTIRGLSKLTKGLGPRFVALSPMAEITLLARQCFRYCDVDDESDLPRERFIQWVKHTPKIVNLVRCFVQREFLTPDEAVVAIQRCFRGFCGRRVASTQRCAQQLELEHEATQAAQKIQDAVVTRKKQRASLRNATIERFAHHGALYTCGANARGQLAHPQLELSKHLVAPLLASFFKHNELRVVSIALSAAHAAAVTSNGHVYTWGSGVPSAFGYLSKQRAHVSTNSSSCATHMSYARRLPTRVDDLDDVDIIDVALGNHHSVALSARGTVYTWGGGGFGQLGHGALPSNNDQDDDDCSTTSNATRDIFTHPFDEHTGRAYPSIELPLQLDSSVFEEMRVVEIACGYYFTIARCDDGSVFTWGDGSDGQLGLGYADTLSVGYLDEHIHGSSFVYMPTPTRVDALRDPIASVAVGGNHVFAVAADHKSVWEWGAWLRRGSSDAQDATFAPQRHVELSGLYVDRIASGKEHAVALTGRVAFTLRVEGPQQQQQQRQLRQDDADDKDDSVRVFGLCARFGATPASLARSLSSGVVVAAPSVDSSSTSTTGSAALASLVHDCSDAHIHARLAHCMGNVVVLDRGTSTGHWLSFLASSSHATLIEIPCVPAAFGLDLETDAAPCGVHATLFYSPQKLRTLRLYVRPDEIVGKLVVLAFDQSDIDLSRSGGSSTNAQLQQPPAPLELSEMISAIMRALVAKVQDAQNAGAAAVVVVFDFLEADAFALEVHDDDDDGFEYTIPVVMVRKRGHGDLLLDAIARTSGRSAAATASAILSFKHDVLGKQILTAQKLGAKAVVVAQSRIEQTPIRLRSDVFASGDEKPLDAASATAATTAGIKIPVVMIPFEGGEAIKAKLVGVDPEDTLGTVSLAGFGHLYAWGYGQNGRLGLGDTENDEIFETGFDGARQTSYQFVSAPEPVLTLFDAQVTHIACGEEHSAAVTNDGKLYCWGSGRDGKLGTGATDDEYAPVEVASLASVRAAKAACGPRQTFVVTHNPSLKATTSSK